MTVTYDTSRVTLVDHPLVQHKLSILRDKNTGTNQFRQLVRELALFDGYEAMRDLPMEDVEVETPITTATFKQLAGKKLAIVPILRAGLGMVDGILDLVPSARVGHIGMERDEVTHEPHEYYCKMPKDIDQRICLVVDPMLATGGSAEMAISYLRERGVKDIRMLCIVAAPEGLKSLTEKDPRCAYLYLRHRRPSQRSCLHRSRPGRRRRPHLRHAVISGPYRLTSKIRRNGARGRTKGDRAHSC